MFISGWTLLITVFIGLYLYEHRNDEPTGKPLPDDVWERMFLPSEEQYVDWLKALPDSKIRHLCWEAQEKPGFKYDSAIINEYNRRGLSLTYRLGRFVGKFL